jgi:hypothetical protein
MLEIFPSGAVEEQVQEFGAVNNGCEERFGSKKTPPGGPQDARIAQSGIRW